MEWAIGLILGGLGLIGAVILFVLALIFYFPLCIIAGAWIGWEMGEGIGMILGLCIGLGLGTVITIIKAMFEDD